MKTYHIRFTSNDFTSKTSKALDAYTTRYTWRTPTYDLYDNPQYKNYSVKKSPYGTDLLGNGVYTGVNKKTATSSETGYISSGRWVDTSGRVDIMDWKVTFDSSISTAVNSFLSVYTNVSATAVPYYSHSTPALVSDWSVQQNILPGRNIFNIDADRYAFFELTFDVDSSISITGKTVEMFISIEIDPPVVNGYFPGTQQVQDKFPEWMDLREWDPQDPFRTSKATPTSVGGQLINSMAGEWLTDLSEKIKYQEFQFHIDTVDMSQKAWVYVSDGVDDIIYSIAGDGINLARTADLEEFYSAEDADSAFFWNRNTNQVFTTKKYTTLLINGQVVLQKPYHVWNSLDDIGVTVDLFRVQSATPTGYLEDNDSFKKRILDVYKNKPGISKDAFSKAMRRELNLWKYWGATPNSDFFGATPDLLEIKDLEKNPQFFTADGMPTQKFKDLVHELALKYPMTWGFFDYEKAFWDADGILGHSGFGTLPRQLDATPVTEQYLESGVGDANDLYVFKPKENDAAIEFNTKLKIRGRQKQTRTEYLPLTMDVKVYGTAADDLWNNPVVTGYFTIELTLIDNSATPASPLQKVYYCNVTASAKNNIDFYKATPTSDARALIEWTTPDGYTDISFEFRDKLTGQTYDGQIPLTSISSVSIIPGHFNGNVSTPSYNNVPSQSSYKLWFDGEPSTILGLGGSSVAITKNPYLWYTHFGAFWFESQLTSHPAATPNSWRSQEFNYTIKLNGASPSMSKKDFTLMLPTINFPESTSDRSIVVEIVSNIGFNLYGAFTDSNSSTPGFIASNYIAVDGNTSWTGGYKKTFATSAQFITFSTVDGAAYPITNAISWIPFEKSITTAITGKVDANGPWRYGLEPQLGNTDYRLASLSLTRDDFGLPNTTDYIVTWIGIESVSDENVITWLDTNTIKPAVTDPGEVNLNFTYPATAIVESLNASNKYQLSTFNIYARLKPGVNQKWFPKVHSGWFYDDTEEYYMYASPNTEQATSATHYLKTVNRQGAPIIIDKNAHNYTAAMDILKDAVFYIDADYASTTNQQLVTNLGTGGDALNARYGSSTGIDASDPKLLPWSGTNYLYLPGVASNGTSVPSAVALDVTGDIEVEIDIAFTTLAPATNTYICAREGADPNRAWAFYLTPTGGLGFRWYPTGSAASQISKTSTVTLGSVGVVAGQRVKLRANLDVDNGASGNDVKFFYSTNGGVSFTQLGATVTTAGTTSLPVVVTPLNPTNASLGGTELDAQVYRMTLRSNPFTSPTTVFDADFTKGITSGGQTSFTATTGQTVTISRSTAGRKSVAVTRPVWLFGTDDYLEVNDDSALDFSPTDSFTVVAVIRQWSNPTSFGRIISKYAGSGAGWTLLNNSTNAQRYLSIADGTNTTNAGTGNPYTIGALNMTSAVRNTTTDFITLYNGSSPQLGTTDTTTGSLANALPMRIGSEATGGSYQDFELNAIAIFRKVLTASEISTLNDYFALSQRPPLNATPSQLRQTAFFNDAATPYALTLSNTQKMMGNGTNELYVAYKDIYNISVKDNTTGQAVSVSSTTSSSNIVTLVTNTLTTHEYAVTYTPRNSYYVDNEYIDTDGTRRTKIVFDQRPIGNSYAVSYEVSPYDPATPVPVPLNPNFTSIEEGFLYIDNDVYDAAQVEVSISPTKIVADGFDYAVVTLRSYDIYGNPKPYQKFNLYTNFGILSDATLTTDIDGFAFTILSSTNWSPSTPSFPATPALLPATPGGSTQGLLLVDGAIDTKVGYEIQIPYQNGNRLIAVLDSDMVLADGSMATFILGKVETATHAPVSHAAIYWRKARNLYDLFKTPHSSSTAEPGSTNINGMVIADGNGRFKIGPFTQSTESGYWLASVETSSSKPGIDILRQATFWIDTDESDVVTNAATPYIKNLGTGGSALNARFGSTVGSDTNDPLFLEHTGTNYLYLPGVAGNYASIPDEAALDLTGDIEIVARVRATAWFPAFPQRIISKVDGASLAAGGGYEMYINGSRIEFQYSDGTVASALTSSTTAPLTNGTTYWVRTVFDSVTRTASYYWAQDQSNEPVVWNTAGVSAAGTGTPSANATILSIGNITGLGAREWNGNIYRVILRSGTSNGPAVLDVDFATGITSGGQTSFTATTGQTVTINRSASGRKAVAVTRSVALLGSDDYFEVPDNALLNFGATDSFSILWVGRSWATPANGGRYIEKYTVGNVGYRLFNNGTLPGRAIMDIGDGTVTSGTGGLAGAFSLGSLSVVTALRNVSGDWVNVYHNNTIAGVNQTDTTTGSLSNTAPLRIGISSTGIFPNDMEFIAAAVFRRALTASEIAQLSNYYNDIFTPMGQTTGDIVYWYEYPNVTSIIDEVTGLPVATSQSATPYSAIPTYTLGSAFPTTYDEAKPEPGYTAGVVAWTPPKWYAIDKYKQYQMGLYGNQYGIAGATPIYPDYKEL